MSAHSEPPPPYPGGDTDKSEPPPPYQPAPPYPMPETNVPNQYQQPQASLQVAYSNNQVVRIINMHQGMRRPDLSRFARHGGDAIIIINGKTYTTIREPVRTTCPCCGAADVLTVLNYKAGRMSFQLSMMLISFGCVLGCCLIPCFRDRNKDAIHCCPNCQGKIFTAPGRFI